MYRKYLKRWLDFVIVFCVLAVIWPILLLVTLWLHFANKGAGAFFTQERPGRNGKIFKVIKFKTMTDERDADGNLLPDAERLTPVGRFVRSTSIDELPQLINGTQTRGTSRNYRLGTVPWEKLHQLDGKIQIGCVVCGPLFVDYRY